jgi:hypothetical protein
MIDSINLGCPPSGDQQDLTDFLANVDISKTTTENAGVFHYDNELFAGSIPGWGLEEPLDPEGKRERTPLVSGSTGYTTPTPDPRTELIQEETKNTGGGEGNTYVPPAPQLLAGIDDDPPAEPVEEEEPGSPTRHGIVSTAVSEDGVTAQERVNRAAERMEQLMCWAMEVNVEFAEAQVPYKTGSTISQSTRA